MYGISAYLSDLADAEKTCAAAHEHGFTAVFSSLHIPEDDPSSYSRSLLQLGAIARGHSMSLIVDMSGRSLSALGLTVSTAAELGHWGVNGVRVDFGFEAADVALLSKAVPVYLNASTVDEHQLSALTSAGLALDGVQAIHNFYPKPHSGLADDFLTNRHRMLHERGIEVGAFVAGDGKRRPPLRRGLPTLERHRDLHPLAAAIDLTCLRTDHVFIGDPGLDRRTAIQFGRYVRHGVIDLTLALTGEGMPPQVRSRLDVVDHNRADPARDLIRLTASRAALNDVRIPPGNAHARPAGSVTVDNDRSGRYRGEICISLDDLPADPSVSVIGHVAQRDLALLATIGPEQAVAFTISD